MSRTLHHGRRAKERNFGIGYSQFRFGDRGNTPPKRKRRELEWQWRSEPSSWIKEMMTVPQRAEVRHLIGVVMKLRDYECAPEFPLPKKPHVYYW